MKTAQLAQLWLHLMTVPQACLKASSCFCFSTRLPMESIVSWAPDCDFSCFLSFFLRFHQSAFLSVFSKMSMWFIITLEVPAAQMVEHCAHKGKVISYFFCRVLKSIKWTYIFSVITSEEFETIFILVMPLTNQRCYNINAMISHIAFRLM